MTKRKQALEIIRISGAENDSKTATRAMIEGKISLEAYREQWTIGQRQGGHFKPLLSDSEPINRAEAMRQIEEAAQRFRNAHKEAQ